MVEERRIPPDSAALNAALGACERAGRGDAALRLLREAEARGTPLEPGCYSAAARALLQSGSETEDIPGKGQQRRAHRRRQQKKQAHRRRRRIQEGRGFVFSLRPWSRRSWRLRSTTLRGTFRTARGAGIASLGEGRPTTT